MGPVTLTAADLVVTQTPLEGWGVATAGGETVALDLAVSAALRSEGYAREAVRLIQEARKASGLEVSDRIAVRWATADADLAAALGEHGRRHRGRGARGVLRAGRRAAAATAARRARPGRGTSTPTPAWGCASGWPWPPDGAGGARRRSAPRRLLLLCGRLAGRAGRAALFLGLRDRYPLHVGVGHEADEDAVGLVVPGHAADHGYQVGSGGVASCRGRRLARGLGGPPRRRLRASARAGVLDRPGAPGRLGRGRCQVASGGRALVWRGLAVPEARCGLAARPCSSPVAGADGFRRRGPWSRRRLVMTGCGPVRGGLRQAAVALRREGPSRERPPAGSRTPGRAACGLVAASAPGVGHRRCSAVPGLPARSCVWPSAWAPAARARRTRRSRPASSSSQE